MITDVWLRIEAVKKYGSWKAGKIGISRTKPGVNSNEIAVKLSLEIPDSIFEEPVYEASLKIPHVARNIPDMVEVAKNVSTELSKRMGIKIKLSIPEEVVEIQP